MSNSDLMLDVGQANELKLAFRRGGWTNEDIKKFCGGDFTTKVRDVLRGFSEVKPIPHLIDCDAAPFIPKDWTVEEHRTSGLLTWDPSKVSLYLSPRQESGTIGGDDLRDELKNLPVMNANVLDYLIANPHLIPDEWKGTFINCWGTIYRNSGSLCVRCLNWNGWRWGWHCFWLESGWGSGDPALVSAGVV